MSTSESATKKLSVKLLVDKERNRVVFAESGKDFVDILFSFLTLPLGTVVRLLGKESSLGCIDTLYKSVEDLETQYLRTPACKTMLLRPRSASGIQCEGLALKFDDSEPQIYYRCPSRRGHCKVSSVPGARCPCGSPTETPFVVSDSCGGDGSDGVFVSGLTGYMISDDLQVKPVSMGVGLSLLSHLGIDDGSVLEKRTVDLGTEEILRLLKRSLVSKMPLTDVFLEETDTINDAKKSGMTEIIQARSKHQTATTESKRTSVKLFLSKESGKVVYAEAGEDFVDLLFSFLTFPLGSIVKLLDRRTSMGCIDNLYTSVELLSSGNDYMKSEVHKTMLLAPKLARYYGCSHQLLRIDEVFPSITASLFGTRGYKTEVHKTDMNPKLQNSGSEGGGGFTKGMVTFMVTDEMVVTPLSPISGVHIINKLMVPISSLEEAEASLGEAEALDLLRACLMSRMALSDVFSPTLLMLLQQRWCGEFPRRSAPF